MSAKPIDAFLNDPLLMAFDALPSDKLLVQEQVALLLECTTRWLEEQRSRGAPPPYVQLGERMIRYTAGPLRDWLRQTIETAPTSLTQHRAQREAQMLGFDEPILRGGRRKKLPAHSLCIVHGNRIEPRRVVVRAARSTRPAGRFPCRPGTRVFGRRRI